MTETEQERLSRECRAMFDDLTERGYIDGTYEEWLSHAAENAAKRLDPPVVIAPEGAR